MPVWMGRAAAPMIPGIPSCLPLMGGEDDCPLPLVWTRSCPACGAWLEKREATAPWVCRCGWRSR